MFAIWHICQSPIDISWHLSSCLLNVLWHVFPKRLDFMFTSLWPENEHQSRYSKPEFIKQCKPSTSEIISFPCLIFSTVSLLWQTVLALNRCRTAKGPRGLQSVVNTPSASDTLATSMVVNVMCAGTFWDTDASWQRMSHAYAGLFC